MLFIIPRGVTRTQPIDHWFPNFFLTRAPPPLHQWWSPQPFQGIVRPHFGKHWYRQIFKVVNPFLATIVASLPAPLGRINFFVKSSTSYQTVAKMRKLGAKKKAEIGLEQSREESWRAFQRATFKSVFPFLYTLRRNQLLSCWAWLVLPVGKISPRQRGSCNVKLNLYATPASAHRKILKCRPPCWKR